MKTTILSATLLMSAMFFSSCSKTAEEAAAEICECYENADGIIAKGGCALDQADYSQDYTGEELEKFTSATSSCLLGAAGDVMDDLGDAIEESGAVEDIKEELTEELDEVLDEAKEEIQESLDNLEDEVEDALEEAAE